MVPFDTTPVRLASALLIDRSLTPQPLVLDWDPQFLAECVEEQQFGEVYTHPSVAALASHSQQQDDSSCSFADCMSLFTAPETLRDTEQVRCSDCKKHEDATRSLELFSLPRILVIHLKRLLPHEKLFTLVNAPMRGFDPSKFMSHSSTQKKELYDLYAVINHLGMNNAGHYTISCLNHADKTWYYYNDSKVSAIAAEDVITNDAYMFFYQRRDVSSDSTLIVSEQTREHLEEPLSKEQTLALDTIAEEERQYRSSCSWSSLFSPYTLALIMVAVAYLLSVADKLNHSAHGRYR
jgi:hypothetical protein